MSWMDKLKSVVGLGPKVAFGEKVVKLPNGRTAIVDARGNFVRFAETGK